MSPRVDSNQPRRLAQPPLPSSSAITAIAISIGVLKMVSSDFSTSAPLTREQAYEGKYIIQTEEKNLSPLEAVQTYKELSEGPVLSSLPVRQTPGSASVDGHGSSSVREILSIGQVLHIVPMSRQPGYLLLSVISAKAASMMRSEGAVVSTI